MMLNDDTRARDMERRLDRVESPEPPADLLERIRGDIPDYLRPVGRLEETPPARGGRYRLLAASVLLAVAGGFLAYRVFQGAPEPQAVSPPQIVRETRAIPPAATTEVGIDEADGRNDAEPGVPVPDPHPTPAQARTTPEAGAGLEVASPPDEYEATPPHEQPAPTAARMPAASDTETAPGAQREPLVIKAEAPELPETTQAVGYLGEQAAAPQPPMSPTHAREKKLAPSERRRLFGPRQDPRRQDEPRRIEVGEPAAPPPPSPSTGGTAEPNDQPWGDMFFRPYGTNPFVDTEDDPRSTFGLDVDTGSYTLARGYLDRRHLPPAEAIRVEEFVNYFDYDDPAPRRGEFTLAVEGAPSPWRRGPRYQLLRIGLHGREISAAQRKDATLIFVVDVSGSMARENRLGLVKQALRLLLDQLGSGDQVGLVVYGSHGRVLLEPSNDLAAVRRAIERLSTGGATNAEEGLMLGYDLARRHYRPESINRLVLCSDGVANVGATGPESILARIGREAEEGIELTTVGFGMGNYNDALMEQLADQGDGNYAYVDSLGEARRVFVENLTGTIQTIASDAKVQVEFDPRAVTRYRLLGYENRDVADHRFRDDTVDAGEIGAGHRVTALYEIKLAEDVSRRRPLAEVRLRYRSRESGRVVEDSVEVRESQFERSWRAASPSLKLAALAAELAEVLKRSYWARETRPEELRERAEAVARAFAGDRDVAELVRMAERVAELVDWPEPPPE